MPPNNSNTTHSRLPPAPPMKPTPDLNRIVKWAIATFGGLGGSLEFAVLWLFVCMKRITYLSMFRCLSRVRLGLNKSRGDRAREAHDRTSRGRCHAASKTPSIDGKG